MTQIWPEAVAPIRPLNQESPYAAGAALKKKDQIHKKNKKNPLRQQKGRDIHSDLQTEIKFNRNKTE